MEADRRELEQLGGCARCVCVCDVLKKMVAEMFLCTQHTYTHTHKTHTHTYTTHTHTKHTQHTHPSFALCIFFFAHAPNDASSSFSPSQHRDVHCAEFFIWYFGVFRLSGVKKKKSEEDERRREIFKCVFF